MPLANTTAQCPASPVSATAKWNPTNAAAGVREMRWVEANRAYLVSSFPGLWVAVYGAEVIASDESLAVVYEAAMNLGARDALIIAVSSDMEKWDHLIA